MASAPQAFGEGELLGNVYSGGQFITDSGWTVTLAPIDVATINRLVEWSGNMWVSPVFHHGRSTMFEWVDPRADGGCGSLENYIAGNLSAREDEVHWSTKTTPPSGKERHCIRPGKYTLTISRGQQPGMSKEIEIDYVPVRGSPNSALHVYNQPLGIDELVEEANYDTTSYMWSDLFVNFELTAAAGNDVPSLQAENAHAAPYGDQFGGPVSYYGGKFDYFRFSSRGSTTPDVGYGKLLSRLWWAGSAFPDRRSGFWDSHSNTGVIRLHQFLDAESTSTFWVGLETMRRSEQPASAPGDSLPITITVPVPAPQGLVVNVSGPDLLDPESPVLESWSQQASNGTPAYHYGTWFYYRYPGPEAPSGSGTSYDRTIDPTSSPYVFRLRASAADDSPQSASGKYFVEVVPAGGGGGGAAAAVERTRMGVRLKDGSCGPRPASGTPRQQWLAWVFESRQGVVEVCQR